MRNLLFVSIFVSIFFISCGTTERDKDKNKNTIKVQTVKPEIINENVIISNGVVQSDKIARLGTRIMGNVNKIYVKKGDRVHAGQLLVSINDQELQAKQAQVEAGMKQSEAAFNLAKKDYERYTRLLNNKSISSKEFEQVELQYKSAQAQLEVMRQQKREVLANRNYTQIQTPFDGLVTSVEADQGTLVAPGQTIITIEKNNNLVVKTQVSEDVINLIKIGNTVSISVPSLNQHFQSEVTELGASSIATGGQYLVTVAIPSDKQKEILSGMNVDVSFSICSDQETPSDAGLWIPNKLLIHRNGMTGVYILSSNNQVLLRWLRLGEKRGEKTEVLSGLSINDEIIIPTEKRLYNGLYVSQ